MERKTCRGCNAPCCGPRTIMSLCDMEAHHLANRGTTLVPLDRQQSEERYRPYITHYFLPNKCGEARTVKGKGGRSLIRCASYNRPERPVICTKLNPGSKACVTWRNLTQAH